MFEKASKLKLRFDTPKGLITTEDLWDIPLVSKSTKRAGLSLDNLAKSLSKATKENAEESFVVKKSSTNTVLELKFDIVKHIINVRLEEMERKENALFIKTQKNKIDNILADKEDEDLKSKSVEDLKKIRAEL